MSKIKKKHVSKLLPGQVAIVLDYAIAMHVAETYDFLAVQNDDEHSDSYRSIADDIRVQSMDSYYSSEDQYEEW
jgi:hypothetical protein